MDTLLTRLDANRRVIFASIAGERRRSGPADSLWIAIAPFQPIYHPRNTEVFAQRLLEGLPVNLHGTNRELTDGYWTAVQYGLSDQDTISTVTTSKTSRPELFKTYGLSIYAEHTSSRIARLTFYPGPVFAEKAARDRGVLTADGSLPNPDLANGYLLKSWIERAQRGEDPFTESPTLGQRVWKLLSRGLG